MAPTAAFLQEIFKTARSGCRQPGNVFIKMLSERNHLASSHGFEVFVSEVGPRPAPNLSLDHIDNNRGSEPSNIRATTKSVQQKNRRPSSEWRRTA